MSEWQNEKEILYPLGATPIEGGAKLLVCAKAKTCRLLLYKKGEPDPVRIEEFKVEERIGDIWQMTLLQD